MEERVPRSLLVAHYRHECVRLPHREKFKEPDPPRNMPAMWGGYDAVAERRKREQGKHLYETYNPDFANGDYQYWSMFGLGAKFGTCRGCGQVVNLKRETRKEHFDQEHKCAYVVRDWGIRMNQVKVCMQCEKHADIKMWGFRFCSMNCLEDFKTTAVPGKIAKKMLDLAREKYLK